LDDIKRFLSDHSGYPTSICRHGGGMQTVVSMISEPAHGACTWHLATRVNNIT
jgi:hypothetical protein